METKNYHEKDCADFLGSKKKCKICGKEFYASGEYAYKKRKNSRVQYYCSWSCLRKGEK